MNVEQSKTHYNSLVEKSKQIGSENLALEERAEKWWFEVGHLIIPDRNTPDWDLMYERCLVIFLRQSLRNV